MRGVLLMGASGGLIAICLDAYTAHMARHLWEAQQVGWIELGIRYQIWHSVTLLAVALLMAIRPDRLLPVAAGALGLGVLLFSGSLYGLAFSGAQSFARATPIGGTFLLIGWALLVIYALRMRPR